MTHTVPTPTPATTQPRAQVAVVYDFDGTLAPGNMQEQSFLPALGIDAKTFWDEAKARARQNDMDEILAYMELMIEHSRQTRTPQTREVFQSYGKRITFFPGVETWFGRVNAYARSLGADVFHFIISSGNHETIDGTSIAGEFRRIFASRFRYDENGVAVWPALAVNYTTKSQFLYRINKGDFTVYDNSKINKYTPEEERPFPFKNFIYIGDGDTDIPAMKMVTYQGGRSIVVYQPERRDEAHRLVAERRADLAMPADYTDGSVLEQAVQAGIRQIAARHAFELCDTSPLKGARPPK